MSLIGSLAADYSAGVPSAESLKNAGFTAVIRYFSPARAAWMLGKPMQAEEVTDMQRNDVLIVANWQRSKNDWVNGAQGGTEDSAMCEQLLHQAGGPLNCVIYASIDANPTDWQLENQIKPYLLAWQNRIGKARMGVYCNKQNIDWCKRNNIGTYFWQHGWDGRSAGTPLTPHPDAHILQFETDKASVDGVGVDRNRILKEDFGQWDAPADPNGGGPVEEAYEVVDGLDIGVGSYSDHNDRKRIYVHSTENQDWNTPAENVARYQARMQDGSYHDLIDDEKILNTVAQNDSAWAVLKDNKNSINIALVLTSGATESWGGSNPNKESRPKTREQWLRHEKMLDMLAWRIAYYATEEDIPIERVDASGVSRDEHGVSSHNNYTYGSTGLWGFKDGTHWDIPDTFPWDSVLERARQYASGSGSSSVQDLFKTALDANPWLGEEVDGTEIRPCPDRKGRYKHYKNGSLYYHPSTGIWAVPETFRATWSSFGWETGFLGYPVGPEEATSRDHKKQKFQHGEIYLKEKNGIAFTVHGAIGATWHSLDAELGKFGMPLSEEIFEENDNLIYQRFENGTIYWRRTEGAVSALYPE